MNARPFCRAFSFIGKRPVSFGGDVDVAFIPTAGRTINDKVHKTPIIANVSVTGPRGALLFPLHQGLCGSIVASDKKNDEFTLHLHRDSDYYEQSTKHQKSFINSMWGTTASHLRQMVTGVSEGHVVPIKLVGVGYKVTLDGGSVNLRVGLSHNVVIPIPRGVDCKAPSSNKIVLSGIDLRQVSQFAAKIRRLRPPEPYSGKGIYVSDEVIKRKQGKKSK